MFFLLLLLLLLLLLGCDDDSFVIAESRMEQPVSRVSAGDNSRVLRW